VSKFVPWPRQIKPREVRALLGTPTNPGSEVAIGSAVPPPPADPFAAARLATASRSISTALALFGVLILGATITYEIVISHADPVTGVISCVFGVAALIASVTLGKRPRHATAAIWTWSLLATGFVLAQCWQTVHFHNPLDIADAIIVIVVIPPITLMWPASLISSGVSAFATGAAAFINYGSSAGSTALTIGGAVAAGFILLHLRARAVDDHTASVLAYRQHATGDPETGLLSWEALCTLAPSVFSLAERGDTIVHLALVRVVDLDRIELDYGEAYADRVIVSVSDALRRQLQPGELLARQAATTFAVLGLGSRDVHALRAKVEEGLAHDQVALGKRPIQFLVSIFKAAPGVNFDELVNELPDALPQG
jgi:GGDEF domain-containing protein